MADNGAKDLYLLHRQGQDKYTYFLLTAAAAGLGFAVQRSDTAPVDATLLILAAAALSWLGSFFCGVRNVSWVQTALYANYGLLQLKGGTHPQQPPDAASTELAIQGVMKALDHNSEKVYRFANWQFGLLVAGGALLVLWQAVRLILKACAA
jgi:hypothetical protein